MSDNPAPEIADHWAKLIEAAKAGDQEAAEFLRMFAPWAAKLLAKVPKQ